MNCKQQSITLGNAYLFHPGFVGSWTQGREARAAGLAVCRQAAYGGGPGGRRSYCRRLEGEGQRGCALLRISFLTCRVREPSPRHSLGFAKCRGFRGFLVSKQSTAKGFPTLGPRPTPRCDRADKWSKHIHHRTIIGLGSRQYYKRNLLFGTPSIRQL